jgi:hypothetical protein
MGRAIRVVAAFGLVVFASGRMAAAQGCPELERHTLVCGTETCTGNANVEYCPTNWPPAVWTCGCYQPITCCGMSFDNFYGLPCGEYCAGCAKTKGGERHAAARGQQRKNVGRGRRSASVALRASATVGTSSSLRHGDERR